jgi:hypothetical protein
MTTITTRTPSFVPAEYSMKVGEMECVVRAAEVWPIPEVLDLKGSFEPGLDATDPVLDDDILADLLSSRMIAPHRPRRRREKSVSSRAVFFAPSAG